MRGLKSKLWCSVSCACCQIDSLTMAGTARQIFTDIGANTVGQAVFVTATLGVTPASGSYRTELTFSGSTFAPNETVKIYLNGDSGAALATATADSSGSFTATARAPQSVYGARNFIGVGQTSRKQGAASFSVEPRLVLDPTSGGVGSTVKAQGYGFGSLEQIKIRWQNPLTVFGIVTADVNGTFNGSAAITFTVPAGAAIGDNTVLGKGLSTGAKATATFTVQ